MLPKHRPPTTPGEILLEEFLKPLGMTQTALAEKMRVPIQRVNTLINGKRGVTAETAILLGRIFKTSPQFWLGLQMDCDLWDAQQKMAKAG
jgi:addiction module HigA family antidote